MVFNLSDKYDYSDLNRIETAIKELWILIAEINPYINDINDIEVGTDLSGKALITTFPDLITDSFWNTEPYSKVIDCGSGNHIIFRVDFGGNNFVEIYYQDELLDTIYMVLAGDVTVNKKHFVLPSDFGTVASIDSFDPSLPYFKETINTIKTDWNTYDFPFLSEIDRIKENLIRLTKYYMLPATFPGLLVGNRTFNFIMANKLEIAVKSMQEAMGKFPLKYSGESYVNDNIWL